jgi:hypothetical protein
MSTINKSSESAAVSIAPIINGYAVQLDLSTITPATPAEEIEEAEEAAARPVHPYTFRIFTPEQYTIRVRAAKRICKLIYEAAVVQHGEELANCYLTHPPYLFYTTREALEKKESTPVLRLYGVCKMPSGEYRAHAVSGLATFNNAVTEGVPLTDMVPLKQWTAEQMTYLTSGILKTPGAFIDPLGFLCFMKNKK